MMSDNNLSEIELSFLNSVTSKNLMEIVIEGAEVTLDSLLESGIAQQIPVFGVLYKGGQAVVGIRDHFFAKKVYNFLTEIKDISQTERTEFIEELNQNENYSQRAGETLMILMDRLDHIKKPQIIGKLLKAKVNNQITLETFLRLAFVVERAYINDLKNLHLYEKGQRYDEDISQSLSSLGLIFQSLIGGDTKFAITNLGKTLLNYGGLKPV